MTKLNPFHLAIPVYNLDRCRQFYRDVLNCKEGRSSDIWVDFDFYGHQLVIHKKEGSPPTSPSDSNPVDGKNVPIPHFGVVLDWEDWQTLADRLVSVNTTFIIEPYIRFKGQAGEQATLFFLDPDGNALEFKAFKDMNQLFAK
jgi:extradiol dioxygenase family protein